ncbi:MAG: SIS domain-containing protein [Candidatus Riflebacteria bacterium]|nr:SIS domain-containing protein [Candidatus Riflebacteria bacterium]
MGKPGKSGKSGTVGKTGKDAVSAVTWAAQVERIRKMLGQTSFRTADGAALAPDEGFARWRDDTLEVRARNGAIFFIGNGASASMASHCSADLAKNAGVHTQVFSDLSLITAISNDLGYENVFREPLRRRATPADLLVAISSSGRSRNILLAAEYAGSLGMKIVTLTGMAPDNPLRAMGTLNVWVAGATYGLIETCHAALLHYWIDAVTGAGGATSGARAGAAAGTPVGAPTPAAAGRRPGGK